MTIALDDDLERFVAQLVDRGRYSSARDALREALRLLEAQEQRRERAVATLETAIRDGLESGEPEDHDMEALIAALESGNNAAQRP